MSASWWIQNRDGAVEGPYGIDIIRDRISRGEITAEANVCRVGAPAWAPAGGDPDLSGLFAAPPPPVPQEASEGPCRRWRRVAALFADGILLGCIGIGMGAFLGPWFARLGPWGRLIGFSVAFPYFGILGSRIGGGRTPGKRLAGIRTVGRDGAPVGLGPSLIRALVLLPPIFLNQLLIPTSVASTWIGVVLGIWIFGVGGGILYLFLFNRRTRQSLHDLCAGTFVVRAAKPFRPPDRAVWRGHLAIAGMLLAVFVGAGFALSRWSAVPWSELHATIRALEGTGRYWSTGAQAGFFQPVGGARKKYLQVRVICREKPVDFEAEAKAVAAIARREVPSARGYDLLSVQVVYGFDIGIARAWQQYAAAKPPSAWR